MFDDEEAGADLLTDQIVDVLMHNEEHAGIDFQKVSEAAAMAFHDAIQNASNNTARSKQQQDHMIGVSTLGHCKNYAALMMKQVPFSDVRDKTAAFFGTVAGAAIEAQLKIDHPNWLFQEDLWFPLPSGGGTGAHPDIIIPFEAQDIEAGFYQGVLDGKSKAELETIKKTGPSQQQIYQVHAYAKAAIEAGLLNPDHPIIVGDVFFDRSGKDVTPYAVMHLYTEDVITFIDEWVNDVKYAVLHGEDASRDMPREWCWSYCEYATVCRGNDTDVEGLLEDPDILAAVEMWEEAKDLKAQAKKKETAFKRTLDGVTGSTGTYNIRWTEVGPVETKASTRSGYKKLSITKVPGARK
jgi:hypothetical protein